MMFSMLEIGGVLLLLAGTFVASTGIFKMPVAMGAWIFGNLTFVALFQHTGQWGLLMQYAGALLISGFGLYQWTRKNEHISARASSAMMQMGSVLAICGALLLFWFMFERTAQNLEWAGGALGLAGAMMLASRSRYAQLCWPVWVFSNLAIIYMIIEYTQQQALMALQVVFLVINLFAIARLSARPVRELTARVLG